MVRHKRTSRCTTRNRLQNRSFHFQITLFIEERTHRIEQFCSFHKRFFHVVVHRQIHVATAVSLLRIRKSIVRFPVSISFYYRKRFQSFCQNCQSINMHRNFPNLCFENCSANSNKIANIKQFFENHIVHCFFLIGRNIISRNINLNTPFRILKFSK